MADATINKKIHYNLVRCTRLNPLYGIDFVELSSLMRVNK